MATWSTDELNRIGTAEELELASRRSDGTLRKPVTIWVARASDDLYVRPVNGRAAAWFRGVQERHEGHIQAGGVAKDVDFVEAGDEVYDQVDAAYRAKYRRYAASIVATTLTPQARAGTLRLVPRA